MDAMKTVLLEKNKRYGDSALNPIRVFSKLNASDGILIRLDDKLSRIVNSKELRTNDVCDMIGYLSLLAISYGYYENGCKDTQEKIKSTYGLFQGLEIDAKSKTTDMNTIIYVISSQKMDFHIAMDIIFNLFAILAEKGTTKEEILNLID